MAFFISVFAIAIPVETLLWAKSTILLGGVLIDLAWYGFAATMLSTRAVQRLYGRFAYGIERILGTVLVTFGVLIISTRL